jgi:hypothetical protein
VTPALSSGKAKALSASKNKL